MIAALRPPAHPMRHTFRGVLLEAPPSRVVLDVLTCTVTVDGEATAFAPETIPAHTIPAHKAKDGRRIQKRRVAAKREPSRNTLAHREARAAKAFAEAV